MQPPTLPLTESEDEVYPRHASPLPSNEQNNYTSDDSSSGESSFWSSPSSDNHNNGFSWSANPQSPTEERPTASPASSATLPILAPSLSIGSHTSRSRFRIPYFFLTFILIGGMAIFTSQVKLRDTRERMQSISQHKKMLDGKLKSYEKDIRVLEREISAMDVMIQKQKELDRPKLRAASKQQRALGEMKELQQRLHEDAVKSMQLKKQVQTLSRDEIVSKYGSGIHQVELELVFPDHHRGPTKFVIELASADQMPHSVHTFLEMVSKGLVDGCSFILNAMHVLKAAPLPYDGSSAAVKAKAFSESGLESVAFKEYNEDYPHKKYTVGFAADGSPSFYINTEDNSEIHVGDPCFGKVISGFDTVQRLEANPTRNGIWFERRIGIKSARLLGSSES